MSCRIFNIKERESNAELLRILCIFAILLHHFCIHALYPEIVSLDMVIQYDFLRPYAHAFGPWKQLGLLLGVTIVFYLLAIGIDQIRILLTQPILNKLR